ncbi:MAG: YggS family pyridoxal phosphate-dependent enzyme [Reinekea sp.]
MTNQPINSRITDIQTQIQHACTTSGRSPDEICLLAVSKTKPLADLVEAYQAGQRHFAENYAQEAIEKCTSTPFSDAIWHFIGPLQSNKTRGIAEHFDWVHTIDRFKIANRLSEQRPEHLSPLNVLIQVNISNDPAKAGVLPHEAPVLADQIAKLPNIKLRGLMTITATDLDKVTLTQQFSELKKLQMTLIKQHSNCTELSMGMSDDFEVAIACGATMVRIGSRLFGARTTSHA